MRLLIRAVLFACLGVVVWAAKATAAPPHPAPLTALHAVAPASSPRPPLLP